MIYEVKYPTGVKTIKKGKWKIISYEERSEHTFLWLFHWYDTRTLYALEPDNEYAYIRLSNINSYEQAVLDKLLFESY